MAATAGLVAATSRAEANWEGDLAKGGGHVRPASGAFGELPISWAARSERPSGINKTSPEEACKAIKTQLDEINGA